MHAYHSLWFLTGSVNSGGADSNYSRLPVVAPTSNLRDDIEQQGDDSHYASIPVEEKKVGYLTSLKSQLYVLAAVLLSGLLVTMIITVLSLSRQGVDWMSLSTPQIDRNQISNMQAITHAKSKFIKVRLHHMIDVPY